MMTKKQLRAAIERFLADTDRVISEVHLCELAGISVDTLRHVFKYKTYDITPMVQVRLEKALAEIQKGGVKIMRKGHTVSAHYRKVPEPEFTRALRLNVKNGKIGIATGLRNVNDYTQPTFREELED